MKVLVVGGGTAGLISAIILKKHLNIQIDVVHSKTIGIVGVGEGSTEHFSEFMNFVGIKDIDIIKECDATYKSGIMFKDWGASDYLHNVGEPFYTKASQYSSVYARLICDREKLNSELHWKNRINRNFLNSGQAPFHQYHFNTYKLNEFLIKFASNMGIKIIEDEINEVVLNEDGSIKKIIGEKLHYAYDFYIDSTGFKKLLIGKTSAKWVSQSKYLKMNSAVVFQTEEDDEYNLWTTARAMQNGWMFSLPVWGRNGNGYIFDKNYSTFEEAKIEAQKFYGKELNFGKEFSFDPGALDTPWVKNCVAIGLSGSFFEPMEASSIGTSIQQSFLLMHKIINYSQKTIDDYNKSFSDIVENIRDFIFLHYKVKKENSLFWKDIQKLEMPDSLRSKLGEWENRLPIKEDFNNLSDYILFSDYNFIVVMEGLNLFNRDSIRKEYNSHSKDIILDAKNIIEFKKQFDAYEPNIGHKQYLSTIRDIF